MEELTRREIALIEENGILRRALELGDLVYACLTARAGGSILITHAEMEFARKNYNLEKTLRTEDLTADIKFVTRLK